jgi:hypothetical protein
MNYLTYEHPKLVGFKNGSLIVWQSIIQNLRCKTKTIDIKINRKIKSDIFV